MVCSAVLIPQELCCCLSNEDMPLKASLLKSNCPDLIFEDLLTRVRSECLSVEPYLKYYKHHSITYDFSPEYQVFLEFIEVIPVVSQKTGPI